MALTVVSFGFKYGLPQEADLVLDVRCLPNPFYVPELKNLTGMDQAVVDYVMAAPESQELLNAAMRACWNMRLPLYVKEGKSQLMIAVGCTGGKHRSITFARKIGEFCRKAGVRPQRAAPRCQAHAVKRADAIPRGGNIVLSFSQEVKNEILRHRITKPCCNVAAAYAVACFGKYFDDRGVVLQTENEGVAQFRPEGLSPLRDSRRCSAARSVPHRGRFLSSA